MILSRNYSISPSFSEKNFLVGMQMHIPLVNTSSIDNTFELLLENHPTVLLTSCFNDDDLPFHEEVVNTELGHLLEHMLIDNLCRTKIKDGYRNATFTGITDWNWKKNPYGFFEIKIPMKKSDRKYIDNALSDTLTVFDMLFASQESEAFGKSPTPTITAEY